MCKSIIVQVKVPNWGVIKRAIEMQHFCSKIQSNKCKQPITKYKPVIFGIPPQLGFF